MEAHRSPHACQQKTLAHMARMVKNAMESDRNYKLKAKLDSPSRE
jgi:hypothetical protein